MTNIEEAWLPVSAYEGRYEVSDLGRVRSLPRLSERWNKQGRPGRILKPIFGSKSYGHVRLYDGNNVYRHVAVHILVLETFVGPRPDERSEGRHLDDDKLHNALTNLAWGTHADNMQDRLRNGRNPQRNITHCPQDHEYDEANTAYRPDGRRRCKKCAVNDTRRRRGQPELP